MKRFLEIVSLLIIMMILNGCWDRQEVNDLAIITGAAFDLKGEDQVEVTLQMISLKRTTGQSGGSSEGSPSMTMVQTGNGRTLMDAVTQIQTRVPRKLFWAHCKVFIFGESFAKKDIGQVIDFSFRHPQPRSQSKLFTYKGRASDLLKLPPSFEYSSSEVFRELSQLNIVMNITFNDLLNMMRREGQAFILPYFENQIVSSNDKPSSILDTSKSAIFHKNKMIGNLDKPATEGIRWFIDNRFDSIKTVELKDMEEPVSFQVNHRKAKLTPKIENGEWSIKVDIAARSVIIMNNTNLALMNPKLLEKINEGLRDRIRKEIESSLLQAQHKLKLDVFGFAQAFNRKYPKQWEKNKRNWQELLPKVKVTLNIQSTISRTGLKTVPIAIPEEEVQQK